MPDYSGQRDADSVRAGFLYSQQSAGHLTGPPWVVGVSPIVSCLEYGAGRLLFRDLSANFRERVE